MGVRVLDLYCGAGGAAKGFDVDGNTIVGVDIAPQPNYPYEFIQADACDFPLDGFDIVHASPPCQGHTTMRGLHLRYDTADMLVHTIRRLRESSVPTWSVENVMGVTYPYDHDFVMCGASFGCITRDGTKLYMARHRKFWTNLPLSIPKCMCSFYRSGGWRCAGVYGTSVGNMREGGVEWKAWKADREQSKTLMGIEWMTRKELIEAIPPVYTRHIYRQWQGMDLWRSSHDRPNDVQSLHS
jgi:DNA (cytosine-5)-methyltransferase 1